MKALLGAELCQCRGEKRAAAAALDHNGVAVLHQFCRAQCDLFLFLVVIGKAPFDIIRAGQDGEAVLSGDQALGFHGVQILADCDLRDAQMR